MPLPCMRWLRAGTASGRGLPVICACCDPSADGRSHRAARLADVKIPGTAHRTDMHSHRPLPTARRCLAARRRCPPPAPHRHALRYAHSSSALPPAADDSHSQATLTVTTRRGSQHLPQVRVAAEGPAPERVISAPASRLPTEHRHAGAPSSICARRQAAQSTQLQSATGCATARVVRTAASCPRYSRPLRAAEGTPRGAGRRLRGPGSDWRMSADEWA